MVVMLVLLQRHHHQHHQAWVSLGKVLVRHRHLQQNNDLDLKEMQFHKTAEPKSLKFHYLLVPELADYCFLLEMRHHHQHRSQGTHLDRRRDFLVKV
jgi:hypothetical protein